MANFLKTALEFTKNIKTTGAIGETSRFVEEEITRPVDPAKVQLIVEFGAGHGNITKAILAKMHPDSKLISFEIEDSFFDELAQLKDPRLELALASAADISQMNLEGKVDCIISSIPITIIPKEFRLEILENARAALKPGGAFNQVLYSRQADLFKKFFEVKECKLVLNFPPAFLHYCIKKSAS